MCPPFLQEIPMKKRERIYKIFIGYDPKERVAAIVLDHLLRRDTPETVDITFLDKEKLERAGLLYSPYQMINGQMIDTKDQRPFSTQFSFSRFLIPALMLWEGWALYMDCDMFPRTDITELFKEYDDPDLPLYCVKHKYEPTDEYKMDNQKQSTYPRKNWSSLMLFNCGHELNKSLTPMIVNSESGAYLHQFKWLPGRDSLIGSIHEEWNWLDGHSPEDVEAKNVHFTTGGPWFKEWQCKRAKDGEYAAEWNMDYSNIALFRSKKDSIDEI